MYNLRNSTKFLRVVSRVTAERQVSSIRPRPETFVYNGETYTKMLFPHTLMARMVNYPWKILYQKTNGETLITSSDDDSIMIYDCEKGLQKKTLNSKKYGVDLVHYTHAANTEIHSSNKVDDTIRYLSLPDNKYIRYFPGHTKKVVTLCMSPIDDTFLSGSLDKTVRLWNLRSLACLGVMHLNGRPVANFDPEGLIFAVGINSESVKLYDLRSFDKGPFQTFKLPQDKDCDWTGLKFSPDGKMIMIHTNGDVIHTIDAFTGEPIGSTDSKIHVWNANTGHKVKVLQADHHVGAVQCVQFNPKYMMLASACTTMAFWIPSPDQ